MPKVSVTLSDEVHAAVRVRAFREGVTLDALGRAFFEGYAEGNGLSAGEQPGEGSSLLAGPPDSQEGPVVRSAPAERPFQPDWKKGKK